MTKKTAAKEETTGEKSSFVAGKPMHQTCEKSYWSIDYER